MQDLRMLMPHAKAGTLISCAFSSYAHICRTDIVTYFLVCSALSGKEPQDKAWGHTSVSEV